SMCGVAIIGCITNTRKLMPIRTTQIVDSSLLTWDGSSVAGTQTLSQKVHLNRYCAALERGQGAACCSTWGHLTVIGASKRRLWAQSIAARQVCTWFELANRVESRCA